MGISPIEIVASVMQNRRARLHMVSALNEIEEELRQLDKHDNQNDVALWKVGDNKYLKKFLSEPTWNNVRVIHSKRLA